jgi:hypothetical protein
MMKTKMIAVLAIAILAIAGIGTAIILGNPSIKDTDNDQTRETENSVSSTVYLIDGETNVKYEVQSENYWGAVTKALVDVNITSAGQITSVNGKTAGTGEAWTVWDWSSIDGWKMTSASKIKSTTAGTNLAVIMSDVSTVNGITSYSEPDMKITYDVYFFIQFREQYDKNAYVTSYLTESERKTGAWVRGTGSDAVEALLDVAKQMGWEIDLDSRESSYGWFNSFFGLNDERNLDGKYTYWSQYQWVDGEWKFNDTTLGRCDLSESPYFALIRQTTVEKGGEAGITVTPADIPKSL